MQQRNNDWCCNIGKMILQQKSDFDEQLDDERVCDEFLLYEVVVWSIHEVSECLEEKSW